MKKYFLILVLISLLLSPNLTQAACPGDPTLWCPPTGTPPSPSGGSFPINTGSVGQSKSGNLFVANLILNSVANLSLGVAPLNQFLTTDDNGNGVWRAPPGGVWAANGNDIGNTNTGNVGIGNNVPASSPGSNPVSGLSAKKLLDVHNPAWVNNDDEQLRVGDLFFNSRKTGSAEISSLTGRGGTGNLLIGTQGNNSQLWLTTSGLVGVGGIPTAGNMFEVKSNQGSSGNSGLRVTYPGGGSLNGTEFGALASRNGFWSALYAKQGAASSAAYFEGNVSIGKETGDFSLIKFFRNGLGSGMTGQVGYPDGSGTFYIDNVGINNIRIRANNTGGLLIDPTGATVVTQGLMLSPTAAGNCNIGLGGKIIYNESASGSELDICMKDGAGANSWNWKVLKIAP